MQGSSEPSPKRQRGEAGASTNESESLVSESLVCHSSSLGPISVLRLLTNGRTVNAITSGARDRYEYDRTVLINAGEAVIFGKDPKLPNECMSDDECLSILPTSLRNPPMKVHSLKIEDKSYSDRHGILWADGSGTVFMRALPRPEDGLCYNGIRVKLLNDWHYAVTKRQAVTKELEPWRVPNYMSKICVDRNNVAWHIVLEWIARPTLCELLCIGCSPKLLPLAQVGSEINEVAHQCQWGPNKVSLCWGCTRESLDAELRSRPTARLHFAGHFDAAGVGSIAFTRPGGALESIKPDVLAELLTPYAAGRNGKLQLVFLNACNSEPLGRKLRAVGVPFVVCWRTPTCDQAARVLAGAFFKACAEAGAFAPSEQQAVRAAFDQAGAAVKAVMVMRKRADGSVVNVPKFQLVAPPDPPPTAMVPHPWPAGLPVLLCDGAADDGGDARVGS